MAGVRIQEAASRRLDEIWRHSQVRWGTPQADSYINGLFSVFHKIGTPEVMSRPVPAAFGVDGYVCRFKHHFIYWRPLGNGDIGIVTILHERMHQIARFQEDIGIG